MEPTVLAGAIEFSPAEIALILAVLASLALLVTAPGWVVLGVAAGRRAGPGTSPGRRWAARVGGALLGIALSAGVASLVGGLLGSFSSAAVVAVLSAWAACWGLAAVLHRSRRPAAGNSPGAGQASTTTSTEGWGR
jgi:hypothetical protein